MARIVSFKTACQLSKKFRKGGKKVIFTSGCFDILHIGHIEFFSKVRRWGGLNSIFFVGVDTDGYLKHYKGVDRPIFNQMVRARVLASLAQADYIVLLQDEKIENPETFLHRFKQLRPEYVVFGNSGKWILNRVRTQALAAGCKFKLLASRVKPGSSSRIAKILDQHFPS